MVIDRQGDARDMYDEILKGFTMFDYGRDSPCLITVGFTMFDYGRDSPCLITVGFTMFDYGRIHHV